MVLAAGIIGASYFSLGNFNSILARTKVVKVTLLSPGIGSDAEEIAAFGESLDVGIQLNELATPKGPAEIENERDSMKVTPFLVSRAIEAEASGADAIVINCMADPGLQAIRESVSIPVVAAGEAAMQWAYMLGGKIGWIDVAADAQWIVQRQFDTYGVSSRYVAFSTIAISPMQLKASRDDVFQRLFENASMMYAESGANTVILGCTLLTELREDLERKLNENGVERFHVVVGLPLAISSAAILANAGLRHF